MKCWSCDNEFYKLLTILTCPKCESMVECYHEKKEEQ